MTVEQFTCARKSGVRRHVVGAKVLHIPADAIEAFRRRLVDRAIADGLQERINAHVRRTRENKG